MQRITQLILNKAQDLQENLESILDMNGFEKPESRIFEPITDLSDLKRMNIAEKTKEDSIIQAFSRLNYYFESGLLLYKKTADHRIETWVPGASFFQGSYYPLSSETMNRQLSVPCLKRFEMKKCAAYLLLQPLHLSQIGDLSEAQAFMIKVHDHFSMILVSQLPEPWLRLHIETVYYSFLKRNLENG